MAESAALVVSLSASLTQFEKDLEKATGIVDKSIQTMQDRFNQANPDASGFLNNLANSARIPAEQAGSNIGVAVAVGLVGGLAGALAARIGETLVELAKLGDLSEELRLPVNTLQELSVAADKAGLSQKELNKELKNFADVSKLNTDDAEKFYEALRNVGKGFETSFIAAKTQEDRLRVVQNALSSTASEADKANLQMQAFGTDSVKSLEVFGRSVDQIDASRAKLKQWGLEVDESAVKKAQEARSELELLYRILTDKVSSAFANLIPTVTPLITLFEKLAAAIRVIRDGFSDVSITTPLPSIDAQVDATQKNLDQLLAMRDRLTSGDTGVGEPGSFQKQFNTVVGGILGTLSNQTDEEKVRAIDDKITEIEAKLQTLKTIKNEAESLQTPTGGSTGAAAFQPRPTLGANDNETFFDRQTEAVKRHIAAMNADAAAIGLTFGAHQQLRAELQLLTAAQRDGESITDEQIDRYGKLRASGKSAADAIAELGINLGSNQQKFLELSARVRDVATSTDQAARAWRGMNEAVQFAGNQMIDIMVGLTQKTLTAQQAMQQLTNALIKALLQASLLGQGPLAGLLGLSSTAQGGTGGLLGGLTSFFKPAGARAIGGPVSQGRGYIVGEHGAELFVPNSSGAIVPNQVSTGSGSSGLRVVVNNYASGQVETTQQRTQGPGIEQLVIGIVKKTLSSGDADADQRGRYGLRPNKVR